MKRNILKMTGLAVLLLSLGLSSSAQTKAEPSQPAQPAKSAKSASKSKSATTTFTTTSDDDDNDYDHEQIIIQKRGEKDVKVVVEIKDGNVKVNGKPVSEFKDDNITITKSKVMVYDGRSLARVPRAAGSPYRSGTWSYDNDHAMELHGASNKGFLGVVTEEDNGAKIKEVTKGSAAEKAGLREGDIITKVDDDKIEDPEDLSDAIGDHKAGEKVSINFLRDKKQQKITVQLGNRSSDMVIAPKMNFRMPKEDFNFDFGPDNQFFYNYDRTGKPRLGIKAQDTEDSKGVKVLEVQDESIAEKAGIKEGDIITHFNEKPINSADELVEQARTAKDLNNIKVKLMRSGKTENIELKIPKKLKTANL